MKDEILEKVYKPGRYLGNEWNAYQDAKPGALKFALCFPDLYEVGMSHLGFRIIYGLLNERDDIICERVFAPDSDLEAIFRQGSIALTSLETDTPLDQFDIVGFSLSGELSYANILNILELGRIPIYACERTEEHPLIIAGGYSCINPEPVADFFDCFIIGEAEEAILEVMECLKGAKLRKTGRKNLLRELSRIAGVYVPSLYAVEYNADDTIKSFTPCESFVPAKIKKRLVRDLDTAFFPRRWIVPYIQIIHDRVILEIMRGCPNTCKFCQAKSVYHPYRVRSKEKVLDLAQELLNSSGYEEVSLLGLSCGDYPYLSEVITSLIAGCKDKGISVSLPSLKAKNYIAGIPALLKTLKKTGLTFAPEAGSKKLRDLLNKDTDIEELLKVIANAYRSGYAHVKLYFMLALPGEEEADLDAIADLAERVVSLRKEIDGKLGMVNLSITAFSPKPHTAFERQAMEGLGKIKEKQEYLFTKIKKNAKLKRAVKIDFHNLEMGFLETALSRAGRKVSGVIYNAFKGGARFDSWSDKFNFNIWLKAFEASGISPDFYANRQIPILEILPWSHIDMGLTSSPI